MCFRWAVVAPRVSRTDELFERIRESAVKGKNDEVMMLSYRQDVNGLINGEICILNTQITELEKYGLHSASERMVLAG